MTSGSLWGLCLLLLVSAWWPRGHELHEKRGRVTIVTMGAGFILASLMPNAWLAAYTVLFVLGLLRVPSPYDRLHLTVWPALLFASLYVVLAPQVTSAWVRPVLWSIVACGLILSAWWAVSVRIGQGHYDRQCQWRGWTYLHLYEHQPAFNVVPKYCCGQGNENFAQALAGAAVAAGVGLIVLGQPWAWGTTLLCALPCLKIRGHWWEWPQPTQGWLYLGAIALTACLGAFGPLGVVGAALLSAGLLAWGWRAYPAFWSGRQVIWRWGWQVWRDMGWKAKLIGGGPESWIHIFNRDVEQRWSRVRHQTSFATHAHNEWVHEWVERGALGTLAMTGYIVTTLWRLSLAGPEGHALLIGGVLLVTCALVSFPWSLYHEMAFLDRGDLTGHGMPVLNVVTLAYALLAEGVLR